MKNLHLTVPLGLLAALHVHAGLAPHMGQDAHSREVRWWSDLDAATREAADSVRPLLVVFR